MALWANRWSCSLAIEMICNGTEKSFGVYVCLQGTALLKWREIRWNWAEDEPVSHLFLLVLVI